MWLALGVLLVWSAWATWPENAWLQYSLSREQFFPYRVGKDQLWLPRQEGELIQKMYLLPLANSGQKNDTLIAPYGPGFYVLLGKKSPVWEIYYLFPDFAWSQDETWRKLERENVRWMLFERKSLDGKEAETRMNETHPLLWRRIQESFAEVFPSPLGKAARLFERKERIFGLAVQP